MDKTIQAQTTYNERICESLVYLMLCKLRRWPRYILIATGMLTAVASGMLMVRDGRVSALPFLMMLLGSLLCTAGLFLRQLASRLLIASYGSHFPTFHYTFTADEVQIRCGEQEHAYSYAFILRLLEMSGLLFMFMRDGQVYILRQEDVHGGYAALKTHLDANVVRQRPPAAD